MTNKANRVECLSNRPHSLWVYRRDNPRGMLGEHDFTSFSSVLPTSQVGYHAGKPIEGSARDLQAFRVF